MGALQVVTRRNPSAAREGTVVGAWANPAGAPVVTSFREAMIAAGYGFHTITSGGLSTPIVGGGNGTTMDVAQPELCIDVPSGAAIMPISIRVACQLPADTTLEVQEILIAVDRTQVHSAHGTATENDPFNMRSDNSRRSVCNVRSAATANHTTATPTLGIELARKQEKTLILTTGLTHGKFTLEYEPKRAPIIVGPAILFVFFGGATAMSGYVEAEWLEFPKGLDGLWGDV